jgi:hypothetical protein
LNSAGDARFANVSIASSLYVGGVSTFVGNAGFSANVSIASALSVGGVAAITGATTIGGNLTLNGGTANGVLFLNGSKVATSGSVLTFDGTNLGIGTTSPETLLTVSKQSSGGEGGYIYIDNPAASALNNKAGIKFGTSTGASFASVPTGEITNVITSSGDGASALTFGTYNGSSSGERMRLDSSGNLGIGTSSPGAKLEVYAGVSSSVDFTGLRMTNGGENGTNLDFYNAFGPLAQIKGTKLGTSSSADEGILTFSTATDSVLSEKMRLDSSGNLGIGTSSPGFKLDVD